MNRTISSLEHDARELQRLVRVLRDEGLMDAAVQVSDAHVQLSLHTDERKDAAAAMAPEERLRDLLR